MSKFYFIQFIAIVSIYKQSLATNGIFQAQLRPPSTYAHQSIYVQPQQQLIIYPHIYRQPIPQYYQSLQNLYNTHNTYSVPQYILQQSTNGFYHHPTMSYIHHENPYQTTSYMNFNLVNRLLNRKSEHNNENNDGELNKSIDSVIIKSNDELNSDGNLDENYKKEMVNKMIMSNKLMETSTMEIMQDTAENEENKENPTTVRIIETELKEKT